jgi:hypothetical protein
MSQKQFKGHMAPGISEMADAKQIGAEIMRGILYPTRGTCKTQDCLDGESPALVTVTVKVVHNGRNKDV